MQMPPDPMGGGSAGMPSGSPAMQGPSPGAGAGAAMPMPLPPMMKKRRKGGKHKLNRRKSRKKG